MKIENIMRATLTPEEKTALNVIAEIDCKDLGCEYCPFNSVSCCIVSLANSILRNMEEHN
jgi:hypothetical protein